ncbi:MAG: methyltransferase domain-containing protein [archaeon]|nr:methyltransferase domain-containing protein [archaeon]
MVFQEGESLYLQGEDGKRYWFRFGLGMVKLGGMGTIDGSRFKDLEDGDAVEIVGRKFNVFRPGVIELIESLDRGAQIITPKDASAILMECNVHAGCRVIEVGAGSGGLTTALLNAVAPTGHVHTIELKEQNAERALKNVKRVGLDAYWSYQIGDAKTVNVEFDGADVLTTDMPDVENALDNLVPHLRNGGRICTYIPNCNQLENAVNALRERGFTDIRSMEIIRRGMDVHPGGVRPSFEMLGHTGYLTFARKRSV